MSKDMSEEEKPQETVKNGDSKIQTIEAVKEDMKNLTGEFKEIFSDFIDLRAGVDRIGTITSIRQSVHLKGVNIWLLVCAIMVASIGLDTNSPAIIIGGMLISPLMYPILGVGLSVGINDRKTLVQSLQNFGVALLVSLITSTLYFWISPFGEVTPEILARTKPTILDVFVGFFGGIAGIVAGSRKEGSNALPGVAIATALLPPICVSGYGLANADWTIFLNSFYLFFLNSVFITIATWMVVRYLKFPYKSHANANQKRQSRWMIAGFSFIVMIPSVLLLRSVVKDIRTQQRVEEFVSNNFNKEDYRALNHKFVLGDTINYLEVVCGGKYIAESKIDSIKSILKESGIPNTKLYVIQTGISAQRIEQLDASQKQLLSEFEKQSEMDKMLIEEQNNINYNIQKKLISAKSDSVMFVNLKSELNMLFPDIRKMAFSESMASDFEKDLKLYSLFIEWDSDLDNKLAKSYDQKISEFVETRFQVDSVMIVHY